MLIVGAGLSGIGAGYHLQQKCPGKSYVILEGRDCIGGTWDLFRYPGIRSDTDMFTLGYSFKPWTEPKAIADGPRILNYVRETAAENDIDRNIRLNHRVKRASWSTSDACWTVEAERTTGEGATEIARFTCNFLFMCSRLLQIRGRLYAGIRWHRGFRRPYRASAAMARRSRLCRKTRGGDRLGRDRSDAGAGDGQDRRPRHHAAAFADLCGVAPGAGSGRQQIAAQSAVKTRLSFDPLAQRVVGHVLLPALPAQAREGEAADPPRRQGGARDDYDIATHFTPRYNPWDQRLCLVPDGDLFNAIKENRASVVTNEIDSFTRNGIRLKDGSELAADIIVTATGWCCRCSAAWRLPSTAAPSISPSTLNYKGMMYSDVPNLASSFGYTNASWTLKCDLTCEYVCRLLNYMDRHGYRQCMPHNVDPTITELPSLDFSSGYVQRSVAKLPKQGSKRPWRLYQNYALDIVSLRYGKIDDGVMRYS